MSSIFYIDPNQVGSPSVQIQVQPFEQDTTLTLTEANFPGLELQVTRILGQPAMATILLPPNSPDSNNSTLGVNPAPASSAVPPTAPGNLQDLASLITPMSTVIIQMTRGTYTAIVFFGVVLSIKETESRNTNTRVTRIIELVCMDLQYYLQNFAYYTLSWLGSINSIFKAIGGFAGVKTLNAKGDVSNEPPQLMASNFMNNVVNAYLVNEQLPVNSGRFTYPQLVENRFGQFASGNIGTVFPFIASFFNAEGTWWNKFTTFFPSPYYEMFFQTFDVTPNAGIPNDTNSGIPPLIAPNSAANTFSMGARQFKNMFVARQMPFPRLRSDTGNPPYTLDTSSWNSLAEYQFAAGTTPFIQSSMEFSQEGARSFYILDPALILQLFGGGTGGAVPSYILYNFAAAVDPINLTKYGYLPEVSQIQWFYSPIANPTETLVSFGSNLLLTLASYYQSLPLSAKGVVTLPLSPTILQGNKITLQPFKNGGDWTFYIESVTHQFGFGRQSITTLQLSRGLPTSVYNNTNGILTAMLQGLVERSNNQYTLIKNPTVLGITGLTLISSANGQKVMNELLPAWGTPGGQAANT